MESTHGKKHPRRGGGALDLVVIVVIDALQMTCLFSKLNQVQSNLYINNISLHDMHFIDFSGLCS